MQLELFKICKRCQSWKPYFSFSKHLTSPGGTKPNCIPCTKEIYQEKYKPKLKNYYELNKERMKADSKRNKKVARDSLKVQRVRRNIEQLALKNHDYYSSAIGCTGKEIHNHLESLFEKDMSWENLGDWHVGFIIPLEEKDAYNVEIRTKLTHFSNTKPVWRLAKEYR